MNKDEKRHERVQNKTALRWLIPGVLFMLGALVGAIAVNHIETSARRFVPRIAMAQYALQEREMAKQNVHKGDYFEAIRHYRNATDGDEARVLFRQKEWRKAYESRLFASILSKRRQFENMVGPSLEGEQTLRAIRHGQVALLLEELGADEEAEAEWNLALSLAPGSKVEEMPELIQRWIAMEWPNELVRRTATRHR